MRLARNLGSYAAWLGLAVGAAFSTALAAGALRAAPLQLFGSALLGDTPALLADFGERASAHRWIAACDTLFTLCYAVAFVALWQLLRRRASVSRALSLACIASALLLIGTDLVENALTFALAGAQASELVASRLAFHASLSDFKWILSAANFTLFGAACWHFERSLAVFAGLFALCVAAGFALAGSDAGEVAMIARGPLAVLSMIPVARAVPAAAR